MKTITPVLWSRLTKNNEKRIFIRVTENRKSIYKSLGISVKPKLWNSEYNRVSKKHPDHVLLNDIIEDEVETIRKMDITRTKSASYLDYHKFYRDDLMEDEKFGSYKKHNTVYQHLVAFKTNQGKADITFEDIDKDFLTKLKSHFTKNKIGKSSQKTYFKLIRHLLVEAIKEGKYSPKLPLETIFPTIITETPMPKALSKEELLKIINHKISLEAEANDLQESKIIFDTINFFLFSFFAYGMRFGDLARLKWGSIQGDIKNQKIHYKMTKTNHEHSLKLFDQLVEILRYYLPFRLKLIYLQNVKDVNLFNYLSEAEKQILLNKQSQKKQKIGENMFFYSKSDDETKENIKSIFERKKSIINKDALRKFIMVQSQNNPNEYIFPILTKNEKELTSEKFYKYVESKLTIYNHNLGRLKNRCGITKKLTSHIARHSFSFISLKEGASLYEISTSLNHQELSTTQIYLRGDSSFVDEPLADIFDNMFKKEGKKDFSKVKLPFN